MPLLFSYGALQREHIQLATCGRLLDGQKDELVRYAPALIKIEDAVMAARLGKTHHANVMPTRNAKSRAAGTVFEVTDAELAGCDTYEAPFHYVRVTAMLASGRETWVYVHAPSIQPRR
jgi:hypothetical protein